MRPWMIVGTLSIVVVAWVWLMTIGLMSRRWLLRLLAAADLRLLRWGMRLGGATFQEQTTMFQLGLCARCKREIARTN